MDSRPIGVFDSGVGGLSILVELQKLLPQENFVFLADQKYLPYGEKTKKELVVRSEKITNYFIKNHDIKMLVVACNTATANTVATLRKKFSIPIVGTIPAIKPASENTISKTIAVMSTPATSRSKALKNLIQEYCGGMNVLSIGCKDLVNTVETGDLSSSKVKILLEKYLETTKNSSADYLVLGCTHYPFLRETIQKIVGKNVKLIDSGQAIAKRARYLVLNNELKNTSKNKGKTTYLTTGRPDKFSKIASQLLNQTLHSEKVAI